MFELDPVLLAQTDLGSALLADWDWLLGGSKRPLFFSAIGNAFLRDTGDGSMHWLSTIDGNLARLAESEEQLGRALRVPGNVQALLRPDFVAALRERGMILRRDQCYGFVPPPALGGEASLENSEVSDVRLHFSLLGQVHRKNRSLPDGTPIRAFVEE